MRHIPACLAALLLLCSCDQMDLCFNHPPHAAGYGINVDASWDLDWQHPYDGGSDWLALWPQLGYGFPYDDLRPAMPQGIRAIVYPQGGSFEKDNLDAAGGSLAMKEGASSILLYNNDTEYIVFNDIGSCATASATTRARARATYAGSPFTRAEEELTVTYPDYLFGCYIPDYQATKNSTPPTVGAAMKPLVCSYLIRFRFDHGFEHVALARGALAGMAGSVFLTDGHTADDVVTVLFDIDFDPHSADFNPMAANNCLSVAVNSFGAPGYPNPYYSSRDSEDLYGLNLELMLNNSKVLTFDFDVSEQVRRQPRGGVIEVSGIVVSDEDAGGASGYDVDVNTWEEYEEVAVEFAPEQ